MLLFIKIVYIFVFCLSTSRFVSLNETYFSRNKQKMVSTFTYTCKSRSALDCGATCSLDDDCWSLSFNDATGVCLLSDIRANVIQDDWIVDENWQTLTKTGRTFCFAFFLSTS